jgi:hypothetical protein
MGQKIKATLESDRRASLWLPAVDMLFSAQNEEDEVRTVAY